MQKSKSGTSKGLMLLSGIETDVTFVVIKPDWKANRFASRYREFDAIVVDGDGNEVHGLTKLGTVRDWYCEE